MKPLTRRQREVLDFIVRHIDVHGYAPSMHEMCWHFGLTSVATIHKHLVNLEKKGAIERTPNEARSIRVLED